MNPTNSFSTFKKERLLQLAQLYANDFSKAEILALANQLKAYIIEVSIKIEVNNLLGVNDLGIYWSISL